MNKPSLPLSDVRRKFNNPLAEPTNERRAVEALAYRVARALGWTQGPKNANGRIVWLEDGKRRDPIEDAAALADRFGLYVRTIGDVSLARGPGGTMSEFHGEGSYHRVIFNVLIMLIVGPSDIEEGEVLFDSSCGPGKVTGFVDGMPIIEDCGIATWYSRQGSSLVSLLRGRGRDYD